MKNPEYIVGIDEVGRGPLAGPVSVGVFVIHKEHMDKIAIAHDSKQVSEKGREEICKEFKKLKSEGLCDYVVVSKSSLMINQNGISNCIKTSIAEGLLKLNIDPNNTEIKLDGMLYAPEKYINQETITKGDSKEKVIGAASIVAKVTRDKFMVNQAKKYPEYGFESHKGYGTKKHREAIREIGTCPLHRDLWVRNILSNK
jgi:ribonuclease HII